MCQSTAFALTDDGEELLLEDVARVDVDGNTVRLQTLFGKPVCLPGRIVEIDLMKHRILLERHHSSTG